MPSPFPGMNPYLENSVLWSGVHHWFITEIARSLNAKLPPQYFVAVEERVYQTLQSELVLMGIPDNTVIQQPTPSLAIENSLQSSRTATLAAIEPIQVTLPMPETLTEAYLEVRRVGTAPVVTAIEVLSPANKRLGEGRHQYEAKRQKVLGSQTHLVEIDLLRQGQAMPILGTTQQTDYRILISRSSIRPRAELYAFNLQQPIPAIPLPLATTEVTPILDLQELLNTIYDQGRFSAMLDYQQNPVPPLDEANLLWLDRWLQQQGLRTKD